MYVVLQKKFNTESGLYKELYKKLLRNKNVLLIKFK